MRRLWRRWREITMAERWLLVRALGWVAAARIALWVLPFSALRRLPKPLIVARTASLTPDRYVWAIRVVSPLVPKASCLTRALALQRMLARAGYPSTIQIGVNMGEEKSFEAHAWVERDGQIVLGAEEAGRYSQLFAW